MAVLALHNMQAGLFQAGHSRRRALGRMLLASLAKQPSEKGQQQGK